jgi:hypothetical protein
MRCKTLRRACAEEDLSHNPRIIVGEDLNSKRKKVATVIVVVIIVVAIVAYEIKPNSSPKLTAAERMILWRSDVPGHGYSGEESFLTWNNLYENESSSAQVDFANDTLDVEPMVIVFNSSVDSFSIFNISKSQDMANCSVANLTIGAQSYIAVVNGYKNIMWVTFVWKNVCTFMITRWSGEPPRTYPWQYNDTVSLAKLQYQKIVNNWP